MAEFGGIDWGLTGDILYRIRSVQMKGKTMIPDWKKYEGIGLTAHPERASFQVLLTLISESKEAIAKITKDMDDNQSTLGRDCRVAARNFDYVSERIVGNYSEGLGKAFMGSPYYGQMLYFKRRLAALEGRFEKILSDEYNKDKMLSESLRNMLVQAQEAGLPVDKKGYVKAIVTGERPCVPGVAFYYMTLVHENPAVRATFNIEANARFKRDQEHGDMFALWQVEGDQGKGLAA